MAEKYKEIIDIEEETAIELKGNCVFCRFKSFKFEVDEWGRCDTCLNFLPTKSFIRYRDGYKCNICDSKKKITIDHIKPTSKGGKNWLYNKWILCIRHNTEKGDKDIVEYLAWLLRSKQITEQRHKSLLARIKEIRTNPFSKSSS